MQMADRIQIRRDTAANWASANPVLAVGEQGYETDTRKMKIGNGSSTWNSLSYFADTTSVDAATLDGLDSTDFATAAQGALADSAIQSADLATVATSGSYTDLSDQPSIPSITGLATETYVDTAVSNLVDTAPAALDTLNELAAALGDDANFAGTVTTSLAAKANTADLATVATTGAYSDLTGTPTVPAALTDLSITDGTAGQLLSADGDGTYTFIDAASGGGGSFEAVASGTLANGDKVVINSDGTVSVVGLVNVVADSASTVSVANFHPTGVSLLNAHVHSYTNKVIIIFGDHNNGNLTTVVVGEISGSSITFGSTVVAVNSEVMPTDIASMPGNKFALFHNDGTSRDHTDIGQITIGTISGTSVTLGTPVNIPGTGVGYTQTITYEPSSDKLVIGTTDSSGRIVLRTGTVSGNNVTFGSTVILDSEYQTSLYRAYDPSTNQIIYAMERNGTVKLRLASVSGTSVTLGSANTIATSSSSVRPANIEMVVDTNQNKVVMAFQNSNGWTRHISLGSISGSSITISPSNNVQISSAATNAAALVFDSTLNKTVMVYPTSAGLTGQVIDASGSYASFESAFLVDAGSSSDYTRKISFDATSGRIVSIYRNSTTGKAAIISSASASTNLTSENFVGVSDGAYASGATATIQTAGSVDDAQSGLTAGQAYFLQEDGTIATTAGTPRVFAGVALSATELMIGKDLPADAVVTYTDSDVATYLTSNGYDTATNIISTITDSAPATLDTLNELAAALGDDANFASTVTSSLALKADTTTVNSSLALKADTSSLATVATSGAYSDLTGTPAAVVPGGSFDAVASGTLANGDKVVVNTDGTVSVVEQNTIPQGAGTPVYVSSNREYTSATFDSNSNKVVIAQGGFDGIATVGTVSGTSISFGSSVQFHTGSVGYTSATFDSNSNKVVISYSTLSVNQGQLAIVGTVSGTSISFGAPTAFNAGAGNFDLAVAATFDSNLNKVVVTYTESYSGTNKNAIVGTVSGTGISFGSPVTFSTTAAWGDMDATFDSNSNKVVVTYTDVNSSSRGKAIVGTVSGTSISFGTEVVFDSGSTQHSKAAFDSNSNKVVIAYRTGSTGKAIVGTVSGTSISFGSSTMFENAAIGGVAATFDSQNNKVLIAYRDYGNSSYGTAVVGTVSGTNISFSSPSVYSAAETAYSFSTFDSISNKVVIAFEGSSGSSTDAVVYQTVTGIVTTNLTSENYVGISDGAYASGATATIQTAGSVDDAQSGLTAGQAYFVQADGTIATTAGTPRVFAGVALSATELMIGRDLPADAGVTYTDSDVATYLSGNGYDTATNIISTITDSAPATLDTLNELAAALGDDANFASTVTSSLALKANTSSLSTVATSGAYSDLTGTPTLSTVATTGAYSDLTGTPAAVVPGGSFEAVASGTLANGDKVVVNADGTISVASLINASASLLHTLDNPNAYGTSADDYVGSVVAISGNYAIVGAYAEDDASGLGSGKAYIYNNSTGALLHTLNNPNPYGTSANDSFGLAVAISDTYAIVSAYEDEAGGIDSGKAYIFDVTTGALLRTLNNPNAYSTSQGDSFGLAVAISDNYAIVGAYSEDDAGGTNSGKAYIFNVSTGALLHTLDNPNAYGTSADDRLGYSVGITDTYAIVGAYGEDDAGGTSSGKAYIYNVSTGALLHTLNNPNAYSTMHGDRFSYSAAISGDYAIVGAPYEGDASGTTSGKAYIYNNSTGALLHTLNNPNPYGTSADDYFGLAVAISGDYAIVGALYEDDAGGNNSGKAYIYNVSTGALVHTLDNPNAYGTSANDSFGVYVAISGNYALVSAYQEDDAGGTQSGKAYIYEMDNTPGTNLTAENFVGVSDGAYADGATATIQTAGSVDDAQSGLTAGQAYYVQGNGTLAVTPGTPSVFAGVALSATKLLIGRDLPADAVAAYTDSDVATYLSGNGYDTATNIISTITDSAPATLDTLNELAAALGDDANFASTVTSSLAAKANTADLATVATSGSYNDLTDQPVIAAGGVSFEAVASGALENGDKVVINADGTISVVSGTVVTTLESVSLSHTLDNPNAYGTSESDNFGTSVATSGNYAIVGAYGEDDAGGTTSGKAYIYNVSTGALLHTLNNPNAYGTIANDYFGYSVAISDNYAIVSANSESDAGGAYSGKAYIFNVTTGALLQTLNNPNAYGTSAYDYFGQKVGISGNYAIVGAPYEDDAGGTTSGKAYIFNVTTGALLHTLNNPNAYSTSASDFFGNAVAISGSYVIVSAPAEDDAGGLGSGKAYIFDVTTGALLYTLDNPNAYGTSADEFGVSVAISGDYIIVGANQEADAGGSLSGKAYIFDVTTGALLRTLNNPNVYGTSAGDQFGWSVAISGSYVIVGTREEDDAGGSESGKAYIFDVTTGALLYTLNNPNAYGTSAGDLFGESVAISGDYIIVGANNEDDAGGTQSGKAYIYDMNVINSITTNLTAENYIGISDASYSDGATATIQIVGSVDDAQSGLTPGQSYYVQVDGTLAVTPSTPSVFAGVALSATKLLIGRDLPAAAVAAYTDSDVATYLSGNGYDTATNIVASITDSAPATLDTLNELAAALGDDANFASTVTSSLALKADTTTVNSSLALKADTTTVNSSLALKADTSSLATVATTGAYSDLTGTPAAVVPGGSFEATASGTLANGDTVIINADGTISLPSLIYPSTSLLHTLDNPNAYGTSAGDRLGQAVAISGNYVIVAATGEDDASGTTSGKAYIFNVSTGALLHTLDNPNAYGTSQDDYFGVSVGISGNYAIVGAHFEGDAGGAYSGKAYIYNVSTGALLHTLDNPNASADDRFGRSVGITDTYAIVGAYYEDDAGGNESGKAYIYNVSTGALLYTLDNPNAYGTSAADNFGNSVAISDTYAIVGAHYEADAGGTRSGKAYIYNVSTGALLQTLDNPNPYGTSLNDFFGAYVAITDTYAIVGATGEEDFSGKVYIYNVSTGALLHTLNNPNAYGTSAGDYFGVSVAISGNYVIVGAYHEEDAGGNDSGKAYIYNVSTGALVHTLNNPNAYGTSAADNFGVSVGISGNYAIVGAFFEDEAGGNDSGKAYIYEMNNITGTTLTAENFVGISDGAYANGATATIQTVGSVDDAQSGLTAGQAYYVQGDGTLGLAPATPRVFAGVAVSATKLLIGRDLPADAAAAYTDSDVATYLSGNGYDTATNIISTITDSAPATLDTLNELAAALGDDANFASTVTSSLAAKANTADLATVATTGAYSDLTGTPTLAPVATSGAYADVTGTPTLAPVATSGAYADVTGTPTLAPVATSGSYNDLTDQPVIGGSFEAVASGTLANGYGVIVNSDGTVSLPSLSYSSASLSQTLDNPNPYSTSAGDEFGVSVATSGNYVIVGARNEDDAAGGDSGQAYIFNSSTGALLHTLTNPNPSQYDRYGSVVAISGNYAIVGSQYGGSAGGGQAHIFNSSTGALLHTLDNPNAPASDDFGSIVAISDNYAIVGAYNEDDASGTESGKAYIYNNSTGALVHTLDNPNPSGTSTGDRFGASIGITDTYVIVGVRNESSYSGKAYIFNVTTGALVRTLNNPNAYGTSAGDRFGNAVAISGNYVIVGASSEDDAGAGASGTDSGKAYIFNVSTGALLHTLTNPNAYGTRQSDFFGQSVAISANYAIVGVASEDDAGGNESGKAYIYNVTTGELLETLDNPNPYGTSANDVFGWSVAISSDYIVVGARDEDDAGGTSSGKAYIFNIVNTTTLTAENYIGISDGAYADGATATIQTVGSVDDAQSGLTAGQAYFLKGDGTLITTPGTPRVFAGVALSATELMIGRDLPADAAYTDSDVATYLSGNGYDTATNIVASITDSAPATLDTLNELAAALNDDANFASTVTSSLALKADIRDTVYALTGTALDRANGGIQTKTLAANTTFTDSLVSGDSLVLQLEAGASYTVTWPTMTWVTSSGNVAPTLTAKDTLVFWKVSSTLYGAYTGSYV
jgi:hypothetical protein